jgi:hypothetical protein
MQSFYYVDSEPYEQLTAIKAMLSDIIDHVRTVEMDDPEARHLFETTAEVLQNLVRDYDNYQRKAEEMVVPGVLPNLAQ